MAMVRNAEYKRRMAKYYNSRVKPRSFQPGDLVLKKVILATKDSREGTLGPNWEGPYLITEVVRPGIYKIQNSDGKVLLHPWNAEHLKRYYQ